MKHYATSLFSLGLFAALSAPAYAQSFVLGTGPEKGCYEKALFGDSGSKRAIDVCNQALAGPLSLTNRAATHNNRGILLMRKGDLKAARKDYEDALEIQPKSNEIQINYAVLSMQMDDTEAALKALNTAINSDIDTKKSFAYYNRAIIHDERRDYRQAYQDLKSALELNPDWPLALKALERYEVKSKTAG